MFFQSLGLQRKLKKALTSKWSDTTVVNEREQMSKYKNKKKVKLAPVVRKQSFVYTSVCCKKVAKKPPVERSAEDRAANEYSQCGLGMWKCTQCEKHCKVTRSRKEESKETDGTNTDSPNVAK